MLCLKNKHSFHHIVYCVVMSVKTFIVAILGGLLLGIGTVFFSLWALSLLSFVCVLYILHHTTYFKERFLGLWLLAGIGYACSFYGLYWETLPLDWLGLSNTIAIPLLFSAWFFSVVLFATCFAFLLSATKKFLSGNWSDSFFIAAIYVVVDVLGMLFYSILFYGANAKLGPHFSMGSPAYQLADSPLLLQAAAFGGLPALIFMQALIGSLLYYFFRYIQQYKHGVVIGLVATLLVVVLSVMPLPLNGRQGDSTVSVAVASLYGVKRYESFRNRLQTVLLSVPPTTNIIALPEDTRFIQYLSEAESGLLQERFVDTYILDSGSIPTHNGLLPEIQYYSTKSDSYATSSKEYLMVFGEYVPYLYILGSQFAGTDNDILNLKMNRFYTTRPSELLFYQGSPMSVKLCSDAMSPWLYAQEVDRGATILFNLASHGWFHQSEIIYELAKRVGRVRAVESGRWYVRAAYETPAFVINDRGVVVRESAWLDVTALSVDVPVLEHQTPYVKFRSLILLIPLFIILCYVYLRYRARISTSHQKEG